MFPHELFFLLSEINSDEISRCLMTVYSWLARFPYHACVIRIHYKKVRVISTLPWLAQLNLFRSSLVYNS